MKAMASSSISSLMMIATATCCGALSSLPLFISASLFFSFAYNTVSAYQFSSRHIHQLSTHQRDNNNNHYLIPSASYGGQQAAAYSLQQHTPLKLSLVRYHRHNTRLGATENEVVANEYDDDEEEHLVGIGVGIDLGTTNSAVAMMIPAKDDDEEYGNNGDGRRRTVPTMIEIDDGSGSGSNTIPSVVAFVPTSDNNANHLQSSENQISLPPWTSDQSIGSDCSSFDNNNNIIQWPTTSIPYEIQIGNSAIQAEQTHPTSAYRNIKRIIGTGGRMANLANGVVPNLFIPSINNKSYADGSSRGSGGSSSNELDVLFNMLEEESDTKAQSKKKKKQQKKGKKSKWKKRKESELPKLHKQLMDAKDDPALLSLCMQKIDSSTGDIIIGDEDDDDILLRPEQISACILRKLYNVAEQHYYNANNNNDNDDGKKKVVKVTRAVIGVPAYFTEAQKQATIMASQLAGVDKVKLLPEPEAAALAYGSSSSSSSPNNNNNNGNDNMMYDNTKEELILVFDLGGGTFDISILETGGGITEVLATVGNNQLGGTDFDKRVAEYLSGSAVEFGRKMKKSSDGSNKGDMKNKNKMDDNDEILHGINNVDVDTNTKSKQNRRLPIVKDWYRHGSGEVPDIILRVAEEVRKALSNQKVVEVLVPLTEDGWRLVGCGSSISGNSDDDDDNGTVMSLTTVIGPFAKSKLQAERNMIEGEDYTIITLDRTTFESICYNELQLLLQPIREVAIMAGVLLPGEARPSFVENAMQMALARDEEAMMQYDDDMYGGQDFWEFENELEDESMNKATSTGKDTVPLPDEEDDTALNEQAMQQIQAMDIKSQKKAQQRGRKKARDIDKRERSFRKQKQSAMEEATTASLLGKQLDSGGKRKRGGGGAASPQQQPATSTSVGNERVQEGIHGRPLSRIVLVGGATRMPVIAKLLEAVVGMIPQRTVHPDEAVALGCAVQVGILDGENEGLLGGMQAVLSPMQAAVMRALAKKRGMDVNDNGELTMMNEDEDNNGAEMEMIMAGGISGLGGGNMMIVDEFDDDDDFY